MGRHVGLQGFDSDEATRAGDDTARQVRAAANGGALQRAALPDEGGLTGAATRLIERLLDIGIDGRGPFDSADTIAERALKHARGDVDQAIKIIRRDHRQLGAVGGFVTGLGGFFTMPIALPANVLEFYLLGTRMTAATAKVRGYDLKQPTSVRPCCSRSSAPTATTSSRRPASWRQGASSPGSPSTDCRPRRSWCSTRRSASGSSGHRRQHVRPARARGAVRRRTARRSHRRLHAEPHRCAGRR